MLCKVSVQFGISKFNRYKSDQLLEWFKIFFFDYEFICKVYTSFSDHNWYLLILKNNKARQDLRPCGGGAIDYNIYEHLYMEL